MLLSLSKFVSLCATQRTERSAGGCSDALAAASISSRICNVNSICFFNIMLCIGLAMRVAMRDLCADMSMQTKLKTMYTYHCVVFAHSYAFSHTAYALHSSHHHIAVCKIEYMVCMTQRVTLLYNTYRAHTTRMASPMHSVLLKKHLLFTLQMRDDSMECHAAFHGMLHH